MIATQVLMSLGPQLNTSSKVQVGTALLGCSGPIGAASCEPHTSALKLPAHLPGHSPTCHRLTAHARHTACCCGAAVQPRHNRHSPLKTHPHGASFCIHICRRRWTDADAATASPDPSWLPQSCQHMPGTLLAGWSSSGAVTVATSPAQNINDKIVVASAQVMVPHRRTSALTSLTPLRTDGGKCTNR